MISATGSVNARIMVVGEAPGREELRQGIPFVGPTGRILWSVARDAGFDRSSCFVTNVVQSEPKGASGNPTSSQILEEWERLDNEMAAAAAEILILVGGIALKRVTGLTNITNMRGYMLVPGDCMPIKRKVRVQVGEYKTTKVGKYAKGDPKYAMKQMALPPILPPRVKWIIPVLHPAGIMRMQLKTLPALRADILRAGRLARGEGMVIGPESLPFEAAQLVPLADVVAIDIETPRPPNDWVVERVGLASVRGVASREWDQEMRDHTLSAFGRTQCTVVLHNSAFDLPRLMPDGVHLRAKLFDTMYAAQLLNPDLPKGLERAATVHLDLRPWKHLFDLDPKIYNAMDAYVTYKLALAQSAVIEKTGQRKVFETMMEALPCLMELTRKGIKVDVERAAAWAKMLEKTLEDAHTRWPAPDVNPASPMQLQKYLYTTLGLPMQYSKEGRPTTDEAAIHYLLEKAPKGEAKDALECLRDIRAASRNLKTYAEVSVSEDGCVHPHYVAADKDEAGASFTQKGQGAGTGRIQARDPNTMNQPREARKLYVPRYPHWCLAYIDWRSAEARVEATLAHDEAMLEAIEGDLHEVIRAALKIDRTRAKNIFYGTGRGAGPRTLARTMADAGFETTERECADMQARLFGLFPKWARWRNAIVDRGRAEGFVTNPFGRRRYFYRMSGAPAMIGFIPQATVADMLWRILPGCMPWLLTPVHDAVLIEAPEDGIEGTIDVVRGVMEQTFDEVTPGFVVPTDVKVGLPGESWGDMEARYEAATC